jgi:hypothetical protein
MGCRYSNPTLVGPETRAVLADAGFGLDDDEDLGPAGPIPVQAWIGTRTT